MLPTMTFPKKEIISNIIGNTYAGNLPFVQTMSGRIVWAAWAPGTCF